MDTKPTETEAEGDNGPEDQDPRSPGAVVGEGAEDQEEDDLDGEGDAVGEEHDAVDAAVGAEEFERAGGAGFEVEEVLEEGAVGKGWSVSYTW